MKTFFIRTFTALIMIAFVIAMFVLSYFVHPVFIDILILLFGWLALYELYNSFMKAEIYMFALPLFVLAVSVFPLYYFLDLIGILISFVVSAALTIGMFAFSKGNVGVEPAEHTNSKYNGRPLIDLTSTIFAMFYPVLFLSCAFVITKNYSPIYALVFAVFMPVLCDTFAYWVGSTVKGKKLCPSISPKKTISGAIGGLIGAMLASVIMFLIFEYFNLLPMLGYVPFTDTMWKSALIYLAIGFVGGVLSQIGDIAASRIKRAVGIKDFGNLFPGHGGAMDRLDSILFTVVLLVIAFTIIYAF